MRVYLFRHPRECRSNSVAKRVETIPITQAHAQISFSVVPRPFEAFVQQATSFFHLSDATHIDTGGLVLVEWQLPLHYC